MNFLRVYLCRFAVRVPPSLFSSFSRQCRFVSLFTNLHVPISAKHPTRVLHYVLASCFEHTFPSACFHYPTVSLPHLSVIWEYRNINLLSITYDFRPQLRSRLTLGGRTFPRKPQTLDGEVSRLPLATYAGILSCIKSTTPYDMASALIHCSSTDMLRISPDFGVKF